MTRAVVVVIALALAIVVFGAVAYQRLFDDDAAATVGPAPVDPALMVADNPLLQPNKPTAAAPAQGMVVRAVRGAVQVKSGDSGAWRDADAGTALAADDVVRAGRGAEATISLGDGVEVKLSPRSELRMREISEALARVRQGYHLGGQPLNREETPCPLSASITASFVPASSACHRC